MGFAGIHGSLVRSLPSHALIPPRTLFSLPGHAEWESECRRLSFNASLGDDVILCRSLARFKMFVSAGDQGLAPHLISDGYWEMWITKAMTDAIEPGMICIDAGANVGYYTLLMADLCMPGGRVVAAEPVLPTKRLLERNVEVNAFNPVVEVMGVAFGAEPGEALLRFPTGEPKNASIVHSGAPDDWERHVAPIIPIDDLDLPRVDFVKIDVEGAEEDVWRGMQRVIQDNPQIQIMMEVNATRSPDRIEAFVAELARRFPLCCVRETGKIEATTLEQVLAADCDVMLYLADR